MNKLKFKPDVKKFVEVDDDFFYLLDKGGYICPEDYLEEDDAKKVRDAIDIINQFHEQGVEEGIFFK